MDFFEHQARRRRRSLWLVLGFLVGVALLVLAIDTAALGIHALTASRGPARFEDALPLLLAVSLVVVVLVGLSSWGRMRSLAAAGGAGVAQSLGGRRVQGAGQTPEERRLLNVVEEMALASGLPTPAVYVLKGERGINAFAAGLTPGDAVVAVTEGALETLDRDELQGVVAHEFSHILNEDMRLNVRLVGLLFGILVLGITGRVVLVSLRHVRVRGKGGAVVAVIALAALALFVLGYVGYFVGLVLKAAVNRQREFLADAAAVQFTRNPAGLAGALRKIGERGSRLKSAGAAEVSHLFFGRAVGGLFSTHPPLEKRLDLLDPGWREARTVEARAAPPRPARAARPGRARSAGSVLDGAVAAAAVTELVGRLDATSPAVGDKAHADLPDAVREACAEPFTARAAALAAVADPRAEVAVPALQQHVGVQDEALASEAVRLHAVVAPLGREAALSVLLLAMPALRQLTDAQRQVFLRTLLELVRGDGVVTLHEHALVELVAFHLGFRPPPKGRPGRGRLQRAVADLLAVLARSDAADEKAAVYAYHLGQEKAALPLAMPARHESPEAAFHVAVQTCRAAPPLVKRRIVEGAAWTVSADGVLSPTEMGLLRLVVDSLGCPMPRL